MANIVAAGAVVTRPGRQVLLVHRPKYDDWSFPKGKLDPGEHVTAAAVREVAEETGLRVRLGPPLTSQRYRVNGGDKDVHYWVARAVGSDEVSDYRPNNEIDEVRWVGFDRARGLLTYDHDRATLEEGFALRRPTRALVVLRHAKARSRSSWSRADRRRPLSDPGAGQAERLVPLLAAYDVTVVATSSSTRCVETVRPCADGIGRPLTPYDVLSEEDATDPAVAAVVQELLAGGEGAVLCTHRPVLPMVFDALGLGQEAEPELATAEAVVVHHRKGRVVATERQGVELRS
ncbi:NUDIX hydrolase [Nocardioides sp.]|uniref:NUDIX hydrolase n=1 Tax=Nocardioides sp. TaxID=35761 RepID=UPI002735968E|nr:NUDIX hydrolase [Nocardioides sp.]MDP3893214.1 NUDIX hydrolase [Nocardioides sp.]